MLTGLVAAAGVGTGLVIFLAPTGTWKIPWLRARGPIHRVSGLMAALYCLLGAVYGGWAFGWAWGLVGYVGGIVLGLSGRTRFSGSGPVAQGKASLSFPSAQRIVDDYKAVLGRSKALEPKPLTALPASKEEVKEAILLIYTHLKDQHARELLKASYTALADFQDRRSGFGERAVESMRLSWEIEQLEAALMANPCSSAHDRPKAGSMEFGPLGRRAAS